MPPECRRLLVLLSLKFRAVDDAVSETSAVAAAHLPARSHELVERIHREALSASECRHERRQLLARLEQQMLQVEQHVRVATTAQTNYD